MCLLLSMERMLHETQAICQRHRMADRRFGQSPGINCSSHLELEMGPHHAQAVLHFGQIHLVQR